MLEKLRALRARLKREQTALVSLIVAYIATGKLGLLLGYVHPATSLVWPPAGIALAAFLVQGYRVWPAVLVSAIVLYTSTIGPVAAVSRTKSSAGSGGFRRGRGGRTRCPPRR